MNFKLRINDAIATKFTTALLPNLDLLGFINKAIIAAPLIVVVKNKWYRHTYTSDFNSLRTVGKLSSPQHVEASPGIKIDSSAKKHTE